MRQGQFDGLQDLRERHYGFTPDFVARRAHLTETRLHEIEAGAAVTVFEAESLAEVYGIDDADTLVERPIKLSLADSLTLLPDHAEFRELTQDARARVLHAARATQDIVTLRAVLGEPDAVGALRKRAQKREPARPGTLPHIVGKDRAVQLRRELGLGVGPIPSMRDLVAQRFPEVAVLHASFGREPVAGLAFVDGVRGPAIVLNREGKNENPLVRRFSLAHELSHLLFDWRQGEPFAEVSGFKDDRQLEREQRANAFAMRFLCPETQLQKLAKKHSAMDATVVLAQEWGIHFEAARLYLRNAASVDAPRDPSPAAMSAQVWPHWAEREDPNLAFPLGATPPERRTELARLAATAYSRGLIPRDRFARLLGLTPADDVERVLDAYSLDAPNPE